MRATGLRERVPVSDPHVEAVVGDEVEESPGALAQQLRGTRIGRERGTLNVQGALGGERLELERIGLAAGGAVEDHPTGWPQRVEALGMREKFGEIGSVDRATQILLSLKYTELLHNHLPLPRVAETQFRCCS